MPSSINEDELQKAIDDINSSAQDGGAGVGATAPVDAGAEMMPPAETGAGEVLTEAGADVAGAVSSDAGVAEANATSATPEAPAGAFDPGAVTPLDNASVEAGMAEAANEVVTEATGENAGATEAASVGTPSEGMDAETTGEGMNTTESAVGEVAGSMNGEATDSMSGGVAPAMNGAVDLTPAADEPDEGAEIEQNASEAPDLVSQSDVAPDLAPQSDVAPDVVSESGDTAPDVVSQDDNSVADLTPNSEPSAEQGDNEQIKADILRDLTPLMDKMELDPEKKFHLYQDIMTTNGDKSVIPSAYEAAKQIGNEQARGEALLSLIEAIDE